MKTLIVFASKTGNTRKLAEHCVTLLQGDTVISSVENAPDPEDFDLQNLGNILRLALSPLNH